MNPRLWIKSPLAIYTGTDQDARGGIVVQGNRIVEILAAGQQPAQPCQNTYDAREHVVIPGLINTHHHFYQTLTRAYPDALNKELFPWLKSLYGVWAHLEPEMHALATRLALTELLLSGCTTAADHHYLFPAGMEQAIDIQVEEAQTLGIRAVLTRGSMSLGEKDGGLPPQSTVQTEEQILLDSERLINRYHERGEGAKIQIALAPC
jgi:8-oxoguanine deaminase